MDNGYKVKITRISRSNLHGIFIMQQRPFQGLGQNVFITKLLKSPIEHTKFITSEVSSWNISIYTYHCFSN